MKTRIVCRKLLTTLTLALLATGTASSLAAEPVQSKELHEAILLYNGNKFQESLNSLNGVLKANPNDEMAHYYKGLSLQSLNKLDDANKELEWVVKNGKAANLTALARRAQKQINSVQSVLIAGKPAKKGAKLPVVYDFFTTWCGPCKMLKPTFEALEAKYKGQVDMMSLDAEDPANKALVDQYNVVAYPTLIFIDSNGKKVDEAAGVLPKAELERRVHKLLTK